MTRGHGKKADAQVTLRPAVQADRRRFHDWLRDFDGTPGHDGLPDLETFAGEKPERHPPAVPAPYRRPCEPGQAASRSSRRDARDTA